MNSSECDDSRVPICSEARIITPDSRLTQARRSGRGNAFLEGGVAVAKSLHQDIVALGQRLESVASAREDCVAKTRKKGRNVRHEEALKSVIADLRHLLDRIDREIPGLQLAISGSRESLDTSLPPSVSPSRLLQASTFLIIGDTQYAGATSPVQIGPSFTLSLYMLFLGHASVSNTGVGDRNKVNNLVNERPATPGTHCSSNDAGDRPYGIGEGERKPLWQEVMHKARVRLCRTPLNYVFDPLAGYRPKNKQEAGPTFTNGLGAFPTDEFAYHLEIIEDLDDGRIHDDALTQPYDSILQAGRRESIPVHHLSKIFYTDTGRVLNIGDSVGSSNPVLLLKRDTAASAPTRMADRLARYESSRADTQPATVESASESEWSDRQSDVDRQLFEEGGVIDESNEEARCTEGEGWRLPSHLDPEWIALEVFEEDEVGSSDPGDSDEETEQTRGQRERHSFDSRVVDQIRHLTLSHTSTTSSGASLRPVSGDVGANHPLTSQEALVTRSPFGAITTSLSLLEMLIRLAGLQEFQQTCHLAIPDHILTFFLEETSTTGLTGEDEWNARNEARRRVGFDPYTDTPGR